MSEMIERVARAIRDAQRLYGSAHEEVVARAAIAAMREPTKDMLEAADYVEEGYLPEYRAMIDAALKEG